MPSFVSVFLHKINLHFLVLHFQLFKFMWILQTCVERKWGNSGPSGTCTDNRTISIMCESIESEIRTVSYRTSDLGEWRGATNRLQFIITAMDLPAIYSNGARKTHWIYCGQATSSSRKRKNAIFRWWWPENLEKNLETTQESQPKTERKWTSTEANTVVWTLLCTEMCEPNGKALSFIWYSNTHRKSTMCINYSFPLLLRVWNVITKCADSVAVINAKLIVLRALAINAEWN